MNCSTYIKTETFRTEMQPMKTNVYMFKFADINFAVCCAEQDINKVKSIYYDLVRARALKVFWAV